MKLICQCMRRSEANRHSSNELKAMKDFDINFVQQRLQTEKRVSSRSSHTACLSCQASRTERRVHLQRTERLRNSLHFLGCATPSNHTVFVDDEQSVRQLSREQHFGTPAELLDRCYNRPTTEQLSAGVATSARHGCAASFRTTSVKALCMMTADD